MLLLWFLIKTDMTGGDIIIEETLENYTYNVKIILPMRPVVENIVDVRLRVAEL